MEITQLHRLFLQSTGACTDTRKEVAGKMFFALQGENFDGNKYASQALAKGASVAVVSDAKLTGENTCVVPDVLLTLQELAHFHRCHFDIPVIGITGSNGKTTTKELLLAVLSEKYRVHATKGNFNNHIGVPLTLLEMTSDHTAAIIEMGANHVGEIAHLARIATPNYGIITNIGKAHLEGFGGLEGVRKAKGELYQYLESNGGTIFINKNDPILMDMALDIERKIFYSIGESASYESNSFQVAFRDDDGMQFQFFDAQKRACQTHSELPGKFNKYNVAIAIAAGIYFGVPGDRIADAVHSYKSGDNRSQVILKGTNRVFLDAYNANPSSLRASVSDFLQDASNPLLIIGEMKELGDYARAEHQELINFLASHQGIRVFLVGREFERVELPKSFEHFTDAHELADHLSNTLIVKSDMLIKGSRSNKLENLLDCL